MKTIKFFLMVLIFPVVVNAQVGPVNFVDTTNQSPGVTKFESADLDNDGHNEIIASFTGSSGKVGFYTNQTNGNFSPINSIDNLSFCQGLAVGDFNNDNWMDIVAIGGIGQEARIYFNSNGTFGSAVKLDSNISIQVQDVVVEKFDSNNSDDMVIIGQHSIDFYKNNGNGSFTKQMILSTSTSPKSLECFDLATKDMDNDGDMDLISGETEGLVIYFNNGNGVFSPNYYSVISEIVFLVHPFDIDNDGDYDVMCKNSFGDIKWFSNNGSGVMTYESILPTASHLSSFNSIDYNGDGLEDLYASYANHISIFENDSSHTFSNEVIVYQDANLIMGAVQIADIDNQGNFDYVWSGANKTIAFHLNQITLSLNEVGSKRNFIFPNPTNGVLYSTTQLEKLSVYNSAGAKIVEATNVNTIDLSSYPKGVYFVLIESKEEVGFQKIVKY